MAVTHFAWKWFWLDQSCTKCLYISTHHDRWNCDWHKGTDRRWHYKSRYFLVDKKLTSE